MKAYPLRREYLICYDITDNKIRGNVFKELEKYGLKPSQKSVFWGYLTMPELAAIKRYLPSALAETDRAFIVRSYFNSIGQSFLFGYGEESFSDWKESDVI